MTLLVVSSVICDQIYTISVFWDVGRLKGPQIWQVLERGKFALLVGFCSAMERLNNNAWSIENYTAPAQKEKLIALRLHCREVGQPSTCVRSHTPSRGGRKSLLHPRLTHKRHTGARGTLVGGDPGLRTQRMCMWACRSPVRCSGEKNKAWATFQPCLLG